jgi:hypothetical protein
MLINICIFLPQPFERSSSMNGMLVLQEVSAGDLVQGVYLLITVDMWVRNGTSMLQGLNEPSSKKSSFFDPY